MKHIHERTTRKGQLIKWHCQDIHRNIERLKNAFAKIGKITFSASLKMGGFKVAVDKQNSR